MMLREFVARLPMDWTPRKVVFPAGCRMAEARATIEDRSAKSESKRALLPTVNLEFLKLRLIEACRRSAWTELSPRDWRYSSECLTIGEPRLIDDEVFVGSYLGSHATLSVPAAADRLARWYIRNFTPDHGGFRSVGAFLSGRLDRLRPNWAELHRSFALFELDEVVPRLADALMTSGKPPPEFLTSIHCPASALSSLLLGRVFVEVCGRITHGPAPAPEVLRMLGGWAYPGAFLYGAVPGAQAMLAEAMLLPWARRFPEEAARSYVVSFLLTVLNDPRTNPTAWTHVSESARGIMLRLMIKDALEQFLEVVDETVQIHQTRMWAERRQFWSSYYDNGYIQECWVVFGRRGAALSRHLAASRNNPALGNFGSFVRDIGGDTSQAVLLMKLGNLLVADWSHNGRCYIWSAGNGRAPKLYQNEYLREDLLSGADIETPHHKNWQDLVRECIAGQLGFGMRR